MSCWKIDLGETAYWNAETKQYDKRNIELSFDSKKSLPFEMMMRYGGSWTNNSSISFKLEFIDDSGLVRINDEFLSLDEEQFSQLLQIDGSWLYEDPCPEPFDFRKWNPTEQHHDLGLVFMYNSKKSEFVMSHLQLFFKWESDSPIILFATTFDDEKMPEVEYKIACERLTLEYIDEISGLHHYKLCEEHCLLTDVQAKNIQSIQSRL